MVVFRGGGARKLFEVNRLKEPDIWYVSYRSNIVPKRDNEERGCVRATRKFKDETEARQFAEEVIANGWSAIAGTLNPHTPKTTIASTQILDWIAGTKVKAQPMSASVLMAHPDIRLRKSPKPGAY
jgi:hypothetical protein